MSVFSATDFDRHEQVIFGSHGESGLRCIVAVHNTVRGPALGGCRMWDYASDDAALKDVLRLSRGMTYKAAVAGLPFGGGKAVIIGDPHSEKSEALLRAYGRFIDTLGGRYITAEDVGTTVADMDIVRQETGFATGLSGGAGDPSPATALGVYLGIRAAVEHALGRDSLAGIRIAVQGLGSVGYRLCRHLAEAGAELFVSDIRAGAMDKAVRDLHAQAVDPGEIHGLEVDVFAPCALGEAINDDTLGRLKAPIVAGAANNQLADPRHGPELMRRGVLYAPDYVINAGGLIKVADEVTGHSPAMVAKKVEGIHQTLRQIFARAKAENAATSVIADKLAEERLLGPPPAFIAA